MSRSLASGMALIAALALAGGPAVADLVYFAGGGRAQVPATVEGDRVQLDAPGGAKVFDRADIERIVVGEDPAREWPGRRESAARDGRIEARFAAAWWALENGLTPEAIECLGEGRLQAASTGHAPSLAALAMVDALGAPCPDPADLAAIFDRLRPARFAEIRSDHVILLHQGDEAEARRRLDVLERVVATFSIAFGAQGFGIAVPPRKLVSAWFAERADYAGFLQRSDAPAFADTQGYYHPTIRAVFAYDTRSGEHQKAGRRAIANRAKGGASASEVDRLSLLLDLEWRATDLGIAAHETAHQLTIASGLAPRMEAFPPWLHEGLAAQFEVVRGGRWAGLGRVNDLRMPDWRAIRPAPRVAPIVRDEAFARGYRRDSYAEAWALVYYLRKARPAAFRTFLDRLRAPGLESVDPHDRAVAAFRAAFGDDLAGLGAAWQAFLADLLTPLEQGQPVGASARGSAGGRAGSPLPGPAPAR